MALSKLSKTASGRPIGRKSIGRKCPGLRRCSVASAAPSMQNLCFQIFTMCGINQLSERCITMDGMVFCSSCDYAVDKTCRDSLRCRPDSIMCPRCHAVDLTDFYSYGSQTHKTRREAWEAGKLKGAPLPFPKSRQETHVLYDRDGRAIYSHPVNIDHWASPEVVEKIRAEVKRVLIDAAGGRYPGFTIQIN